MGNNYPCAPSTVAISFSIGTPAIWFLSPHQRRPMHDPITPLPGSPETFVPAALAAVKARGRLTPELEPMVRELLIAGFCDQPTVTASCSSRRTLRRRLRRSGMPPPVDWIGLSRCLRTLFRASDPSVSLGRAAIDTYWYDSSSFSRRCLGLFGRRPGKLCKCSVDELIELWLKRRSPKLKNARGTRRRSEPAETTALVRGNRHPTGAEAV